MEEIAVRMVEAALAGAISAPPAPAQTLRFSHRRTQPQSSLSQELRRRFEGRVRQALPIAQPTQASRNWTRVLDDLVTPVIVDLISCCIDLETIRAVWRNWRDNREFKVYMLLLYCSNFGIGMLFMFAVVTFAADLESMSLNRYFSG